MKRTAAVYCRASSNSAVAGIPAAVAVDVVLHVVLAAAVNPAVTEVL